VTFTATATDAVRARLAAARVIAVLGAHHEAHRPAFYVPEYLFRQGYRILPVNPALVGQVLWGEPVQATLQHWRGQFDIVDVFRRADALPAHVEEILGASRPGSLVWFQAGIRNDAVAAQLSAAGLDVVQDRCTLADHRAWGIGPVARS
jgi:predicted CoA-binding protein